MARILANYFASVYHADEGRDHPSLPEPSTIMNVPHFTPAAVHMEFSTLDTAKGSGPDDLQLFMFQFLADFLGERIKSPRIGAIICPIFTVGDPEDAANYL